MTDIEALDEQQSDEERTADSAPDSPGAGAVGAGRRGVPDDGTAGARLEVPDDGVPGASRLDSPAAVSGDGAGDDVAARAAEEASEVEIDLDALVKTAAQRDEYLALAQRTQADFENYRKRVARDSATAHERGVAKLAKELLPALDSLDRALEGAAQDDPLLDGVRLVRAELGAALGRVGIEAFSPLGEAFDPNEHEAVAQAPVEGAQSGTVAEVYQTGYRSVGAVGAVGAPGVVIRPARVLVAA